MIKISIIYFSGAGSTAKLAETVSKGATSVAGITTQIIAINGEDIINGRYQNDKVLSALDASDAIIFGSPTYMGGVAAQFKAFADASVSSWVDQKWRNKLAAGFTISGTPSGDKFSTLQYFHTLAMEHGMVWLSLGEKPVQLNGVNRLGSWGGVMAMTDSHSATGELHADDKLTGELLGKRVAEYALRIKD